MFQTYPKFVSRRTWITLLIKKTSQKKPKGDHSFQKRGGGSGEVWSWSQIQWFFFDAFPNFVKFRLQSMSSKIERAFEKRTKNVFVFILPIPTLKYFSLHFTKFIWWITFLKISMTFIKVVKNQIFKKIYLPLKPTWRSCFFLFHWHDPKWKQSHQISTCRAKKRSTQIQTCVKHRGNIICIKRNTDVNTGDLKILHKKMSK